MITIIDYEVGNLFSIKNILKKIGVKSQIIADPEKAKDAEKLILPGVGNFGHGMQKLRESGWEEMLNQKVLTEKTPILGICLGMQLLTQGSEEAPDVKGLGWFEADTRKFVFNENPKRLKVPHMGWNDVKVENNSRLFDGFEEERRFYFVHSYHVVCENSADVMGTTHYGYDFTCALEKDNILGAQFHPEKSHRFGMQLLKNFANNY
ncbi:imidazole glycerol phosphate synthase subunit HisH [bacterium SCSIO 12741]|nr:imidazole glycerol phosphate synthase subunit HisH [bacterium SCSIO 12741]